MRGKDRNLLLAFLVIFVAFGTLVARKYLLTAPPPPAPAPPAERIVRSPPARSDPVILMVSVICSVLPPVSTSRSVSGRAYLNQIFQGSQMGRCLADGPGYGKLM